MAFDDEGRWCFQPAEDEEDPKSEFLFFRRSEVKDDASSSKTSDESATAAESFDACFEHFNEITEKIDTKLSETESDLREHAQKVEDEESVGASAAFEEIVDEPATRGAPVPTLTCTREVSVSLVPRRRSKERLRHRLSSDSLGQNDQAFVFIPDRPDAKPVLVTGVLVNTVSAPEGKA